MPQITPYTSPSFYAKVTVGTSAAALPATSSFENRVQADPNNAVNVVIGDTNVTAAGGGKPAMVFVPGQVEYLNIADLSKFFAVASASATLYVMGLR